MLFMYNPALYSSERSSRLEEENKSGRSVEKTINLLMVLLVKLKPRPETRKFAMFAL